jgi:hypothetical protein
MKLTNLAIFIFCVIIGLACSFSGNINVNLYDESQIEKELKQIRIILKDWKDNDTK